MGVVGKQCPAPAAYDGTAIRLLGGRPLSAIYEQRMCREPQFPRFGHRINSHL